MDTRILTAVRLMERNIGEDVQVDALAAEAGLSLHHFHRLFVSEMGEPPAGYLRRIRMDEAAFRLKWANETAGEIAHALGFLSRPAFIRAFERQFGLAPTAYRSGFRAAALTLGDHSGSPVFMREMSAMQILSRRYIGDISRMRTYWEDFCNRLPQSSASVGSKLYVGMLHDDPRVTEPDKVRYDCGVALSRDRRVLDDEHADQGLHMVETLPGAYAGIRHLGPHSSIPETYDLLCHKWIVPSGRAPAASPALEIHAAPRHLQDPECVDLTMLVPVE